MAKSPSMWRHDRIADLTDPSRGGDSVRLSGKITARYRSIASRRSFDFAQDDGNKQEGPPFGGPLSSLPDSGASRSGPELCSWIRRELYGQDVGLCRRAQGLLMGLGRALALGPGGLGAIVLGQMHTTSQIIRDAGWRLADALREQAADTFTGDLPAEGLGCWPPPSSMNLPASPSAA